MFILYSLFNREKWTLNFFKNSPPPLKKYFREETKRGKKRNDKTKMRVDVDGV
jgi:hypothetical protein